MPNIIQLIALQEKYNTLKRSDVIVKDFLNKELLENIAIEKSFKLNDKFILEHFNVSTPTLIDYFESRPTEEVVLLFIDIANFSVTTEKKNSHFISSYLDNYYKSAIPIIYEYGGQIEKIMGDGIICVFGKPFIDVYWPEEFNRAELCAKALINKFQGTTKEVKIALHNGVITYYKTPGTDYEEYTMIGKPLTELFRLESVLRTNAINFYATSIYDSIKPSTELGLSKIKSSAINSFCFNVLLQGVEYTKVHYIKFK